MHDFFGNTSVVATSTYESLRAGTSNCSADGDRAAYWAPTLMTPHGDRVRPERAVVYYRNRPVADGRTVAFPSGLRMVAGGTYPYAYWTCDGQTRRRASSRGSRQFPTAARAARSRRTCSSRPVGTGSTATRRTTAATSRTASAKTVARRAATRSAVRDRIRSRSRSSTCASSTTSPTAAATGSRTRTCSRTPTSSTPGCSATCTPWSSDASDGSGSPAGSSTNPERAVLDHTACRWARSSNSCTFSSTHCQNRSTPASKETVGVQPSSRSARRMSLM